MMKKKIKKLTALVLAAVGATTAGGALVACNNKEDNPPPAVEQTQCTVTFDTDGGSAVSSVTVNKGDKLTEPTAPTKDGYEFVGWYKEGMTEQWNFETDTVSDNLTLYALWNEQAATADTFFDFTATGNTFAIKAKLGQTLPENVIIPSAHEGKAITSIADEAFAGQNAITSIKIPASVKEVGARSFRNCTKLLTVNGGENVEKIGSAAFNGTAWENRLSGASYLGKCLYKYAGNIPANTELTVKDGTVGIAAGAMQDGKNIVKVTLPATIKYIGNYAFGSANANSGAQITEVTIPDTAEEIGDSAFRNCSALATVKIGSGVQRIGASAFAGTAITDLTYNANAEVNESAFSSAAAATLKLGNDVTEIPVNITKGMTGLTAVTLGAEIDKVPDNAFDGLANLATVTINGTLTEIGNYAFRGTAITAFTVGKEVTKIGAGAFASCAHLASVTYNAVNAQTTTAVGAPFTGCSLLATATIGADVTAIPSYLFCNVSALKTVTLGNNVTEIGTQAFYGTAVTSVTIPSKVAEIGANAFGNISALKTVTYNATAAEYDGTTTLFPNAETITVGAGVTKIPAYFVKGNTVIQSITLPSGVAVGDYAFNGCSALGEIEGYDNVGSVGANAFDGCKYYEENLTDGLIVQGSTITGYRGDMPANFTLDASVIPAGKTVTSVAPSAFKGKTNLAAINLPASVVTVGANAFEGTSVAGVIDLSNVTEIGAGAFKGLTGITAVTLNEGVTKIGAEAFSGCSNAVMTLKANSLTELGKSAFYDCAKLTSVEVNGVAEIPEYCFYGAALTSVKLGNSVETVGDSWATLSGVTTFTAPALKHAGENGFRNLDAAYDFSGLVSLGRYAMVGVGGANTQITFGANLESLGENLFGTLSGSAISGNTDITKVTINSGKLTDIPAYCFAGCSNLTSVVFDDCKVTSVGAYAFHTCKLTAFDFANVKTIGEYAFCDSGLTSATFGDNLEKIGQYAFNNSKNLGGALTLGQKLTAIPVNAFSHTAITSLTVKGNIKLLDTAAFMSCSRLTTAVLEDGVQEIADAALQVDLILRNTVLTIPSTVTSIGKNALGGSIRVNIRGGFADATLSGKVVSDGAVIIVPAAQLNTYKTSDKWASCADMIYADDTVNAAGAIVINGELVKYASLETSIEIPADVTSIAKGALGKVETITVAEGNTALSANENVVFSKDGTKLVYYPAKLTAASYEIPETVTAIEAGAFYNTAVTELTFNSETPPTLGENAFEQTGLTKITVPAGKADAYKAAAGFSDYASLIVAAGEEAQEFVIADNVLVKYNGNSATVVIPDNVTSIAVGAFDGCDFITELTLGANIQSIAKDSTTSKNGMAGLTGLQTLNFNSTAFKDCAFGTKPFEKNVLPALKTINVGEGVTRIPNYVFYIAAATKITFPSTLKTIGQYAFDDMMSLEEIDWGTSQVTTLEEYAFYTQHSFKMTEIVIPASVTSIGDQAFGGQTLATTLKWNAVNVTTIGTGIFSNTGITTIEFGEGVKTIPAITKLGVKASNVTSLTLPSTVKTIADNAFNGCANMVCEFVMPAGIESIGASAFEGCAKMTGTITSFPATITSIGGRAFAGCAMLSGDWNTITVSQTLFQNCGESPFDGCVNLVGTNVKLPDGMTKWSTDFYSGTGITSVDLTGITEIGDYAFYYCSKLTECDLSKVTKVGESAFYGAGLTSVNLDSVTTIGGSAFRECMSLHKAVIGAGCTSIGTRGFGNGDVNIEVTFKGTTPPTITKNSFGSSSAFKGKIYVPAESVATYKAADIWSANFADKIEAIPTDGGETGGTGETETPTSQSLEALPDTKQNI